MNEWRRSHLIYARLLKASRPIAEKFLREFSAYIRYGYFDFRQSNNKESK